jgi:Homeobox KN domain
MMSPDHVAHPYPTEQEKAKIMEDTGIELKQLTNWFVNNRKRFWKPRVEARLQQQQSQVQLVSFPIIGGTNLTCSLPIGQVLAPETSAKLVSNQESQNVFISSDKQVKTFPESSSSHEFMMTPTLIHDDARANASSVSSNNAQVHRVSDASLSGSEENGSDDESNLETETDDWEDVSNRVTMTETVNVHVLRPTGGGYPTIEDVTTLSNVPTSRILKSFYNIQFSFSYPREMADDRDKVRSKMDKSQIP